MPHLTSLLFPITAPHRKPPFSTITLALETNRTLQRRAKSLKEKLEGMDERYEQMTAALGDMTWHRTPLMLASQQRDQQREELAHSAAVEQGAGWRDDGTSPPRGAGVAEERSLFERAQWRGARRAAVSINRVMPFSTGGEREGFTCSV